jgi:hypothetical protein
LRLRLLDALFLLGLRLLLPALLSRRLCALLLLRSALPPFGSGLSFRLAAIFASIRPFFLLIPLRITGSDRPGEPNQGDHGDYSY